MPSALLTGALPGPVACPVSWSQLLVPPLTFYQDMGQPGQQFPKLCKVYCYHSHYTYGVVGLKLIPEF